MQGAHVLPLPQTTVAGRAAMGLHAMGLGYPESLFAQTLTILERKTPVTTRLKGK